MVINRDCEKRIKFSLYPHYSRKSFGEGGVTYLISMLSGWAWLPTGHCWLKAQNNFPAGAGQIVQSNLFSLRQMYTFPLPHICIDPPPPSYKTRVFTMLWLCSLKLNEGKMKLNLACNWVVLYMGNQPEKMSSHPRSWPDKTYFSPYTDLWPAFTWSPIAIRTWEFIQENILQVTLPLLKLASLREAG